MAVVIRRLEESDETDKFDCGGAALNNYLHKYAWANQEKSSIGVTYVAADEAVPRGVLGYFTLAMSSVPRDARANLGGISEAFRISLRVSAEVGCRCIVTDAYRERTSWYARYGFVPIEGSAPDGPQRMFLDVRTIRSALQAR